MTLTEQLTRFFNQESKYFKHYYTLVTRASGRQYDALIHEKHHIIPRSFGGPDDDWNLATLTFKEHYIAHLLLTKITADVYLRSMMNRAFRLQSNRYIESGCEFIRSRKYSYYRTIGRETESVRIYNPVTKLSIQKHKDAPIPEGWIAGSGPKSEDHKKKIGDAHRGKDKPCPTARGKKWYYHPETLARIQVMANGVAPEGYIPGTPPGTATAVGVYSWFNESTGEYKKMKGDPGEGWIRKGKPKSKDMLDKMVATKKARKAAGAEYKTTTGRIWCHDPVSQESIRITDMSLLPEGWVLGCSHVHKEKIKEASTGRKQTAADKERSRLVNSSDYLVQFSDGTTKLFEKMGMKLISESLGIKMHILYGIKDGKNGTKYGIISITKVD